MNPHDRLRREILVARYLEALEAEDFETQIALWKRAESEPELVPLFRQLHDDLLAEYAQTELERTGAHVADAVEKHLTSAEIVRPTTGPVTVADVANELFRHAPDRLPAQSHVLNEHLRTSTEPLPEDLGFSKLVAWAEAKFGTASDDYWRAFRQAAITLELRRASESEYQLAARSAPKPEDRK